MMKTLFIIDDDDSIRKQLSFTFSSAYNILEATSLESALAIIDENKNIDIALVDLGLPPFENSYKAGRMIVTKLSEKSKAKIIVLTGQESKEYSQELIAMGVFDYILKPVDVITLSNALQRASFFLDNSMKEDDQHIQISFEASLEDGLKGSSDEAQKRLLLKILEKTGFNINQTAKILKISRENCYYFLKKFAIERPHD